MNKFDRSLLTVDIQGAQPKQKGSIQSKLLPPEFRYAELQAPRQDPQFSRKRYQHDFHHFCNSCVPQGENYFDNTNKKHYEVHEGEIKQYRALENYFDQPKILVGDRVLDARDIDGAIPGSMQSKAVRNQEKAQRMRQERDYLKAQNVKALYLSQVEEPQQQQRAKSYSIQEPQNETQKYETPKYEYMNKPLKIPQFGERESPVINPISNKLQLRQNYKNYLSEDYDKTISMLQQPTRLYV